MASSPITRWQIYGEKVEAMADFIFLDFKIIVDGDCSHDIKGHLLLGRKVVTNSVFKRETSLYWQNPYSQSYGFSSNHEWMWELDYKEAWAPKNWCLQTVKTLESLGQQGDQTSQLFWFFALCKIFKYVIHR